MEFDESKAVPYLHCKAENKENKIWAYQIDEETYIARGLCGHIGLVDKDVFELNYERVIES